MKKIALILLMTSAFFAGCGGSSGGETKSLTGTFIDAPVAGLKYTASPSGKSGTTNAAGEFQYQTGDKVSFKMGTLSLGSGEPDTNKKIKITQLPNATLIGQLLQTLDLDDAEDKIDVSGIVIPDAIVQAILDKLGNASSEDIITDTDLAEIKTQNTTIAIPATTVKPQSEVVDHIVAQTADDSLIFTEAELNNQIFVSKSALEKNLSGRIVRFNKDDKARWIDGDLTPLSHYSKHPWSVDAGKLKMTFYKNDNSPNMCTFTKIGENNTTIDISISCEDGHSGLDHLYKSQTFSTNDLTGKTIKLIGTGDSPNTPINFTFNADGTYSSTANDASSGTEYKDTNYENTIWVGFDPQKPHNGVLVTLVKGTLTNGTLIAVGYDEFNHYKGTSIFNTSGNTWTKINKSSDGNGSPSQPGSTLEGLIYNQTYYVAVCDSYENASGTTISNNHVETLAFDNNGGLNISWIEDGQAKQGQITYSINNEQLTLNLPDGTSATFTSIEDKGGYLEISTQGETEKGKFHKNSSDAETELATKCGATTTDQAIPVTAAMLSNKVFYSEGGDSQSTIFAKMTVSADGATVSRREIRHNGDGSIQSDETGSFTPVYTTDGKIEVSGTKSDGTLFYMLFTLNSNDTDKWTLTRQDGETGDDPIFNTEIWYFSKPSNFPSNL